MYAKHTGALRVKVPSPLVLVGSHVKLYAVREKSNRVGRIEDSSQTTSIEKKQLRWKGGTGLLLAGVGTILRTEASAFNRKDKGSTHRPSPYFYGNVNAVTAYRP